MTSLINPATRSHPEDRAFFPPVKTRFARSRTWRRLVRNRAGLAALLFVVVLSAVAIAAPLLAPFGPDTSSGRPFEGPGGAHLLGTDQLGRDTLSRLIMATRVTLLAACQGVVLAIMLGVPLGLIAGYRAGRLDSLLSRIADGLLSLPPLIFAMALVGVLGRDLTNVMLAIGVLLSPRFFRVTRAAAMEIGRETFIEACRAVGVPPARLLTRHFLPNAAGPLLVQASFAVGVVISAEASLSFLGLGVQIPDASWGSMLQTSFASISRNAFPIFPPAVMITLTILAFATLGDAVRDAMGRDSHGQ